ncbi:heparinase II/III family protein [Streptomyces sp. NPDC019224]|uniref:heparinase II/III domain-containing protein n=1 Tax=Streptomyces sp. NPDC019224 TaxID=3154484 RepID=UPI003406260F
MKQLKTKLSDPIVSSCYQGLLQAARLDTDGTLTDGVFSMPVRSAIEALAFRYLVERDEKIGARAVTCLRNFLDTFKPLDPHQAGTTDIRNTGLALTLSALVYDWCHALLTADDRQAVIATMKTLAAHQEVGYPPTNLSSITSHASEYELQRDQLAAGIAVYDEDPEMFDLVSARFHKEYVPAHNFFYGSGRHHQGDSYQGTRFAGDMYATILFDRMGGNAGFSAQQQQIITDWIYQRRPDGQLLRAGDSFQSSSPPGKYWRDGYTIASMLLSTAHYENAWHQDLLLQQLEHGYKPGGEENLLFCLFYNPDLPRKAASTLPLTRLTPLPLAGLIARTGWEEGPDAETAITQVNIGGYQFNNHQHLDAGAFQIYYRGALALDSGIYESKEGSYGSSHDVNYHKRTIAHNALLIRDPREIFQWYDNKISNDGGQRFPADAVEPADLTELLDPSNHHANARSVTGWAGPDRKHPTFSHIKGNITAAYSSKARLVTRACVSINLGRAGHPTALIVRDTITTADAAFETAFLLHSAEKPTVDGPHVDIARTDNTNSGRLRMTTLAPSSHRITTIGGPGHEFDVDGVNYAATPRDNTAVDPGAWRVEVAPSTQSATTQFLHVLQPHAADVEPYPVTSTHVSGAFLVRLSNTLTVFSSGGRNLNRAIDFRITEEDGAHTEFLATDLPSTGWQLVRRDRRSEPVRGQVRRGNILYARLTPGTYQLIR